MMENNSNQRIVKNTLLLYIRMFFMLIINLYTSRVILDALGVVDYGIYNVVGGVVVLFSYMNSALSLATTRFFSYEMHNGIQRLKMTYNNSIAVQTIFAAIIFVIAETIGLWLVNCKLVIPTDRIAAANFVYQFSVFTTLLSIIAVTYMSSITAHEKMGTFAFVTVIESVLKLLVAVCIYSSPIDTLVFYGLGIMAITVLMFVVKIGYCKQYFEEIKFDRTFDKVEIKKMLSFVGWNFFGATAGMSVGQGLNFVINIFFGPAVNAARGIAYQVEGAVSNFVTSINTAVNPQIVKRYSTNDFEGMFKLVFFSSKISFLLLLLVSLPIIIDADYILGLWLKKVPDYTILFTRLILIYLLTLSLTHAINMSAQATGKIRAFQMTEGIIVMMNIPISIILFQLGCEAYLSFVVMIVLSVTSFFAKIYVLSRILSFPLLAYIKNVLSRVLFVTFLCIGIYIIAQDYDVGNLPMFIMKTMAYYIPLGCFIWVLCFDKKERAIVTKYINKIVPSNKRM